MPVAFKPKAGKPHIFLYIDIHRCYLWFCNADDMSATKIFPIKNYCLRVNPLKPGYSNPGEAARALHGIKL